MVVIKRFGNFVVNAAGYIVRVLSMFSVLVCLFKSFFLILIVCGLNSFSNLTYSGYLILIMESFFWFFLGVFGFKLWAKEFVFKIVVKGE